MLTLIAFGALIFLTAWLPMILKEASLLLPIVCVLIGAVNSGAFWSSSCRTPRLGSLPLKR
jgi:hypothetical protein